MKKVYLLLLLLCAFASTIAHAQVDNIGSFVGATSDGRPTGDGVSIYLANANYPPSPLVDDSFVCDPDCRIDTDGSGSPNGWSSGLMYAMIGNNLDYVGIAPDANIVINEPADIIAGIDLSNVDNGPEGLGILPETFVTDRFKDNCHGCIAIGDVSEERFYPVHLNVRLHDGDGFMQFQTPYDGLQFDYDESYSVALGASAVAVIKEAYPSLSPHEIRSLLMLSADPISYEEIQEGNVRDSDIIHPNFVAGAGFINIDKALNTPVILSDMYGSDNNPYMIDIGKGQRIGRTITNISDNPVTLSFDSSRLFEPEVNSITIEPGESAEVYFRQVDTWNPTDNGYEWITDTHPQDMLFFQIDDNQYHFTPYSSHAIKNGHFSEIWNPLLPNESLQYESAHKYQIGHYFNLLREEFQPKNLSFVDGLDIHNQSPYIEVHGWEHIVTESGEHQIELSLTYLKESNTDLVVYGADLHIESANTPYGKQSGIEQTTTHQGGLPTNEQVTWTFDLVNDVIEETVVGIKIEEQNPAQGYVEIMPPMEIFFHIPGPNIHHVSAQESVLNSDGSYTLVNNQSYPISFTVGLATDEGRGGDFPEYLNIADTKLTSPDGEQLTFDLGNNEQYETNVLYIELDAGESAEIDLDSTVYDHYNLVLATYYGRDYVEPGGETNWTYLPIYNVEVDNIDHIYATLDGSDDVRPEESSWENPTTVFRALAEAGVDSYIHLGAGEYRFDTAELVSLGALGDNESLLYTEAMAIIGGYDTPSSMNGTSYLVGDGSLNLVFNNGQYGVVDPSVNLISLQNIAVTEFSSVIIPAYEMVELNDTLLVGNDELLISSTAFRSSDSVIERTNIGGIFSASSDGQPIKCYVTNSQIQLIDQYNQCLTLPVTGYEVPSAGEFTLPTFNDPTCDGTWNLIDAVFIKQYDVSLISHTGCSADTTPLFDENLCDVNGDGSCGLIDAVITQQCNALINNPFCSELN